MSTVHQPAPATRAGRTWRRALVTWAALITSAVVVSALGSVGVEPPASAQTGVTLYAAPDGPSTTCLSPASACALQEAIAVATGGSYSTDAVTIDAAAGTYHEVPASNTDPFAEIVSAASLASLTVQGAGASTTDLAPVGGGGFEVYTGTVTISGLAITDVSSPGPTAISIAPGASLTASDDTISDNHVSLDDAGAVFNGGALFATGDTFADDTAIGALGGAIDNGGPLTATDDTFVDDSGAFGGAIYNGSSTVTATDDTFANDNAGEGGAIWNNSGTTTVANSILSVASCYDLNGGGGAIVDGGYNVESDDSCGFGPGDTPPSLVDSPNIGLAPSLAANGSSGPETLAITASSSAFEEVAAGACTPSTDERGDPRPGLAGQRCDAGAYELELVPTTPPPSSQATATTLSSSANPSVVGQAVTYTATVSTVTVPPAPPSSGTVAFADGATYIAGCSAVAVAPTTGVATCTVGPYGGAGAHTITAQYLGGAPGYRPSTSVSLAQVVAPVLARVSPGSGLAAGGTVVTLTGRGFSPGATSVSFGSKPATGVTCTSGTTCRATTPPGPQGGATVDVTVSVAGATSPTSTADRFTYRPCPAGNSGFICQAYLDLLHRAVDPAGLATWSAALATGQLSRTQVAGEIIASTEYRSDLVTEWYKSFLSRSPSPAETASWVRVLASGQTERTVIAAIVASPEFYARSGGTTTGFVSRAYLDLLGRAVDPNGLRTWSAALGAGISRLQVATALIVSVEYRDREIAAWYSTYLRRPATAAEVSAWLDLLQGGASEAQCTADIIGSPEYLARLGP